MYLGKTVPHIQFFYFTPLDFDTVFKTQVIGWVNLYREAGLDYSIVKIYPIKHILKQKKRKNDIRGIKQLYQGPLYFIYAFPDRFFIGRIINLFTYIFVFKKIVFTKFKFTIQTRGIGMHSSLQLFRNITKNRLKIIYDARAAAAEEFKYTYNPLNDSQKKRYNDILENELNMAKMADKVFSVSNNLKNYLIIQNTNLDSKKFFINPCNANHKHFYFNESERHEIRKILNIENRFAVVYSGGFELKWHIPSEIFSAFLKIKEEIPEAFFIILSNDKSSAEKHCIEKNIYKQDYTILSLENTNVRPYLNAADIGLLIRENVPMNNVASPTKFAEYVMCGLPLIISPGVGDFSNLVNEKKIGVIYRFDENINMKTMFSELSIPYSLDKRQNLSIWGKQNFSKQSRLNHIISVYNSIYI